MDKWIVERESCVCVSTSYGSTVIEGMRDLATTNEANETPCTLTYDVRVSCNSRLYSTPNAPILECCSLSIYRD